MRVLVFSLDDNYLMPFQVLLHSLFTTDSLLENTKIYVIHEESLTQNSIKTISDFCSKYGQRLIFINATNHLPKKLPVSKRDHVSRATFYRLFLSSILPANIKSAVYLDIDIIILRSIKELLTLELNKPIAAVDHLSPYNQIRLWGEEGGTYFQAGITIFDLEKLRADNYESIFIKTIQEEKSKLKWWDQDVLNIAFRDNWQRISIWYNVIQAVISLNTIKQVKKNARIIHYDGSNKPWSNFVKRPLMDEWMDAYKKTFLESYAKPEVSFRNKLIYYAKSKIKCLIKCTDTGIQ